MKKWLAILILVSILALSFGRDLRAEGAKKIQDNSFLIEEAYNQEDGVVQHIQSFQIMDPGAWTYTFTQEWPAPTQKHQLSYTVPVVRLDELGAVAGWGDLLLNYRYQAVLNGPTAFSPRLSLLVPTGDVRAGRGNGALGVQANLPLSVELGDHFVSHWNLGMTWVPEGRESDGDRVSLTSGNYGGSLIWLAHENFNLMLEAAGTAAATLWPGGEVEQTNTFYLSPGMRFAINFDSGLQIVPGLALPIGIGPSSGEYGALFYLSFEHPLSRPD